MLGTSRKIPDGPMSDSQMCAGEKSGGKDTCQVNLTLDGHSPVTSHCWAYASFPVREKDWSLMAHVLCYVHCCLAHILLLHITIVIRCLYDNNRDRQPYVLSGARWGDLKDRNPDCK